MVIGKTRASSFFCRAGIEPDLIAVEIRKLHRHILGAIAEFERARIAERVKAGPSFRQDAREAAGPSGA